MGTKLIFYSTSGIGDYLFSTILSIYLKNKYDEIYIYYDKIHFNNLQNLTSRILEENNVTNIKCIGNPSYKIDSQSDKFIYLDDVNLCDKVKNIIYTDPNNGIQANEDNEDKITYLNILKTLTDINVTEIFYFQSVLNYFNLNYYQLISSINFNLNDLEKSINHDLYINFSNKINNEKYILLFHCTERSQNIFSFRDYHYDYNKKDVKIINMCRRFNEFNTNVQMFYIDEIIGEFPMNYLHTIIELAEEIHMYDSFPLHYVSSVMINNSNHKLLDKIISYPRNIVGYSSEESNSMIKNFKLNKNYINNINFSIFNSIYEIHYPLNYFNNKLVNNKDISILNKSINFCLDDRYLNYTNNNDYNLDKHEKNLKKNLLILSELKNLKLLPCVCSNNNIGLYTKTITKNINFIDIDIDLYDKNKNNLYKFINNILVNDSDNKNKLNILLLKTSGEYILKIKPFKEQIENEIIELNSNYEKIDKLLLDIINDYLENEKIHYIYPYNNVNDKNNFELKIKKCSEIFFNNDINHIHYTF